MDPVQLTEAIDFFRTGRKREALVERYTPALAQQELQADLERELQK